MSNKIQIKRGNKTSLPQLADGELGFCKDTGELFVGSANKNILINTTITPIAVIDDGYSTDKTAALSANQGRLLNDKISTNVDRVVTNANGSYLRFSSGVQIAWGAKTFSTGSMSSYGAIFYATGEKILFPVTFIGKPPIPIVSLNDNNRIGVSAYNVTTSEIGKTYVFDVINRSPYTQTISWVAIGRWKS